MIHRIPKTQIRRALTLREFASKDAEELARLVAAGWLLPMAGGAPDDDDDDDAEKGKKGKKADDDDDDDGDEITVSKSEHDGLKKTVGALRKELRDLKAEKESAADDDDKKAGKFEDLYKKAEAKIAELESTNADLTKGSMARDVASRLNFHNPARAVKMLDLADIEDEGDAERALKSLAKSDTYLVSGKKRTTGKVGDDDPANKGDDDGADADTDAKGGKTDARSPEQKMSDAYAAGGADSAGAQE